MGTYLVKDGEKYVGAYVAIDDPRSGVVLAASHDPAVAVREAKRQGCADPILVYVPRPEDGAFAY